MVVTAHRVPHTTVLEGADELVLGVGVASRRDAEELLLSTEDFEVFETEHQSACATAIAIDISHSMILYGEDRFTPAKKVALALTELILQKYPKDTIDVVLFGDDAVSVDAAINVDRQGFAGELIDQGQDPSGCHHACHYCPSGTDERQRPSASDTRIAAVSQAPATLRCPAAPMSSARCASADCGTPQSSATANSKGL